MIGLTAFIVGIGQLKFFTIYGVTRGIILFVGFIVLIRLYGLNGAGISYLCSLVLDVVFVVYSLKRRLDFSVLSSFKQSYLGPCVIGVVLGAGLFLARDWITGWLALITAFAAFGIFYLLFTLILRVIDKKERNAILSVLKIR